MKFGGNRGFFLLILLLLAVALLAGGCRKEEKEAASPTATSPPPAQEESPREGEPSTGQLTSAGEEKMVVEGEKEFITEADVVKAIWSRFQRERDKAKRELKLWLEQTISTLQQESLFPKGKEDEQFKAFMLSLLRHCLTSPQDRLCQEPWKLSRLLIEVYTLNTIQLTELEEGLRGMIAKNTSLASDEVRRAAAALKEVFAGEATCVKEGICALEGLFSGFTKLNAEIKAKLLWDIQSYLRRQARDRGWQHDPNLPSVILVFSEY